MSRSLSSALLGMLLVGCSASAPSPFVHPRVALPGVPAADRKKSSVSAVPSLPSVLLAAVPPGTYGPYVGERPAGVVYVWASVRPDDPQQRRAWYTAALQGGQLQGPAVRVAAAPSDIGLCAVEPAGGPNPYHDTKPNAAGAPGFVVLSTRVKNGLQQVEDFVVGVRGELRGLPTALNVPSGEVLWVDAIPTSRGTLALWAVRRETSADLYVTALGLDGEKLSDVHKVLGHARAWQAAPAQDGAAVAAVVSNNSASSAGRVVLAHIDRNGHAHWPFTISNSPTAGLDLDMVTVKDQLVLAWSDRRGIEPRLYTAVVDDRGQLKHAPAPATRAVGAQTLVQLVPPRDPASDAYAAWENLNQRPQGGGRVIQLARLDSSGTLGAARGALRTTSSAGSTPEMKATAHGLAALTVAAACRVGRACGAAPELPTFVQFDKTFHVTETEPVRLDALGGRGASLAWGLTCRTRGCSLLAAPATSPAPVYVVAASHHTVRWKAPAWRVVPPPPPRAMSNQAIAAIDSISGLAARRVGAGTLVAWVTTFDPQTPDERLKRAAPDGRFEPLRAKLQVRAVADDGSLSNPHTISLRARSPGGVSLAAGNPARHDALLAWAALNRKIPEAFVTLLNGQGKKLAQRMLTHGKHQVRDVATAFVGDGWLVGWVDGARADAEIRVTKVNRQLVRVAPVRRVKSTAGAKSGLAMIAHDKTAQLVWAQAPSGATGAGLFGVQVQGRDAAPLGAARRLAPGVTPPRSIALASHGSGAVVAWVDATPGSTSTSSVYLAALAPDGQPQGAPVSVSGTGGAAQAVSVSCPSDRCRGVMVRNRELRAFEWRPAEQHPRPVQLVDLVGASDEQALPVLLERDAYFADHIHAATVRLRRVRIQWR